MHDSAKAHAIQSIYDLRIKEVHEVDCGSDTDTVNKMLSDGWVLLRIRTETKQEGSSIIEYPLYILGLPSE